MDKATAARRTHVEPLWDRIERNRLRVGAFVVLFVFAAGVSAALIVALGAALLGITLVAKAGLRDYFVAYPYLVAGALVLGAGLAIAHVVRMLRDPGRRLPRLFGAERSKTGTLPTTKSALHDMALAAGYAYPPPLWVIDDCDRVNAFALGFDERDAVVGVTRGFAERLSEDDQRAAFANLMARLRAGDTFAATVVSAIMGPIWAARAADLRKQEGRVEEATAGLLTADAVVGGGRRSMGPAGLFILGFLAVVLTELLMTGHERAALAAAEKADAEGMLLLKDPTQMLTGLTHVLEANNTVPGAGEEYSMLFFCWAGFGYAPEDDPEMERVGRLREVLGAEGWGEVPVP